MVQTTKTTITIPMIKMFVNPKEPNIAPLEFNEVNGMEVELVVEEEWEVIDWLVVVFVVGEGVSEEFDVGVGAGVGGG